jgi:hypothetical protein
VIYNGGLSPRRIAFDLLELGGVDLRVERLEERRSRLQHLMHKITRPGLQYNDLIEGEGATVFEHACRLGFGGIVFEAPGAPLPMGADQVVNQGQESDGSGRAAVPGGESRDIEMRPNCWE